VQVLLGFPPLGEKVSLHHFGESDLSICSLNKRVPLTKCGSRLPIRLREGAPSPLAIPSRRYTSPSCQFPLQHKAQTFKVPNSKWGTQHRQRSHCQGASPDSIHHHSLGNSRFHMAGSASCPLQSCPRPLLRAQAGLSFPTISS
jgi:hypothetical protein